MSASKCVFCEIVAERATAYWVYEDDACIAFLDARPLFVGHVLLVPREHHETLADLPPALVEPLFGAARKLARAVESALGAQGTFVAMNNRVSQSVPHLHVHVVPRKKGDGLRGFFWPRLRPTPDAMEHAAEAIRSALASEETAKPS